MVLCFPTSPLSVLPCKIGNPEDNTLCVQHSPTPAALLTSFLLNHAPQQPCSLDTSITWFRSHTASWAWVVSQKDWRNQTASSIQAMHWYSIWV